MGRGGPTHTPGCAEFCLEQPQKQIDKNVLCKKKSMRPHACVPKHAHTPECVGVEEGCISAHTGPVVRHFAPPVQLLGHDAVLQDEPDTQLLRGGAKWAPTPPSRVATTHDCGSAEGWGQGGRDPCEGGGQTLTSWTRRIVPSRNNVSHAVSSRGCRLPSRSKVAAGRDP